ncbi:16S rRNA (adenine(1518)-N(6)/adenine(1519)-N(6))-dimethyltransferase RsmA [Herpetosiphon llansteffanensis]|uniref:16S rRNA (adenine(1518)-N(6)/adenine(1519)-N(6))- dimethyltransferase RsmA n=1 Tax=Herpetosiphon llansteffanensis TaxID=2094568 RepID=UPI000D7CF88A|nr:16S rRNA (adenine(1518)-N(6)/adenine(1519)-N(6))-dimethyltransferase RsmA [Herpetosiphon llansteffanensis]
MNPYTDPSRVRGALHSIGVRPSKSMGQNFLVDPTPLKLALEHADVNANDVVIEVGPGLGVLTWELLNAAGQVISVELDTRLAGRLRTEFAARPLTIVESDVLELAPSAMLAAAGLPADTPYKLVANIPYAITSPLLRHFLEGDSPPSLMMVLMQWEVADRITAKPGDLSILAHSVQLYATAEIVARVPAASFFPSPAVDSALVLMRRRPTNAVPTNPKALFKVIRAGFSQARKKLINSLAGGLAGQGYNKEQVLAAITAAGIDSNLRAEVLTLDQWATLTDSLGMATK